MDTGSGYGNGYGNGDGDGYGNGDGDGYGYGYGDGYGNPCPGIRAVIDGVEDNTLVNIYLLEVIV